MLDSRLAAFLEQGLGMHMATRNEALQPNGARVSAIKVTDHGTTVVVYLPVRSAGALLDDLRQNGQAAVVCVWPPDDRGCQVKGTFVDARPAAADEEPFVRGQWEALRDALEAVGLPRLATEGWVVWPCTAIRLRVNAVFDQTPGPGAGAPLS